ncbi:MAG: hydrogenase maturation nickel metallochaperone HypA [Chloroflexota bacterium]
MAVSIIVQSGEPNKLEESERMCHPLFGPRRPSVSRQRDQERWVAGCRLGAKGYNDQALQASSVVEVEWGPMHELSVTESLLEIAVRHAEEAGAERIVRLNIVLGEFSSIVDESVQFYWDIVSADTIAEGAELHFERVAGTLRCLACGHEFPLGSDSFNCPACGEAEVVVAGGDDFRLESIEVE